MAVTINAKGTSVPYFKIGKQGTTLYQGDSDPSASYTVNTNDIWFDTTNGTVKFRVSNAWSGITTASDLTVTGDLTVQGTTTTVNSTEIQVQNSLKFEGSTSNDFETNLTVVNPTADRTITLPNATDTLVGKATTDTLTNKTISDATSISIAGAGSSSLLSSSLDKMQIQVTESNSLVNSARFEPQGIFLNTSNTITFEGATADNYETILSVVDPTADRTVSLPNETGIIVTKDSDTGAVVIPTGTTAQRPGTPEQGMLRFNTDADYFEVYNGASWVRLGHTLATGDSHNFGSITETSDVASINYGAITDTDTDNYTYDRGLITDSDIVSLWLFIH